MGEERMVVLASSRKCGGYCLAGKTLAAAGHVGAWLRPVTGAGEDGLPRQRTLCTDGQPAAILDVVTLDCGRPAPNLHQRENQLMAAPALRRGGRVAWEDLPLLADQAASALWIDGHSSLCGVNDRVPARRLSELAGSLLLLAVSELVLARESGYAGRIKYRADFRIAQRGYNLALTDSVASSWLQGAHRLALADAYLCVSLALPFQDGFAYKLAAAVITSERAEGRR